MTKYYLYHCNISELDLDLPEDKISIVFEANTDDSTVLPLSKSKACEELRDMLDAHCDKPLHKEIERLNRVVATLDLKLADALTF